MDKSKLMLSQSWLISYLPRNYIADTKVYTYIQGVPFTTVFFQRDTAPTKNVRFQKFLHWQVGNELTFMWVLFVAT